MRIGDYVTLRNIKHDGLMYAEGILNEDLDVCDNLNNFDNSLFCIHYQRQYSAAKELEEFLGLYSSESNSKDESTAKYLKALEVSSIVLLYILTNSNLS